MNTDLLRPVAAAMFEVPLDAEPDAVERALLERLRDWELKLPPQGVTAYRLLTSGDAPDGAAWYPLPLLAERNCLQAIGEFADQYFELPISLRRAQWDELHAIGRHFPRSRAWLEQLRRGLNVEPGACDDPAVAELAAGICALWIARPDRYAAARHALWERALADPERLQRAAQALRRQARELARLEPELVDTLRRWDKITKRAARRWPKPKAPMNFWPMLYVGLYVLTIFGIMIFAFVILTAEQRRRQDQLPERYRRTYTLEEIESGNTDLTEIELKLMGFSEDFIASVRARQRDESPPPRKFFTAEDLDERIKARQSPQNTELREPPWKFNPSESQPSAGSDE